jgi:anti-sigma factor RsiW
MACEVSRTQLDAYLDGELSSADAAAIGAHIRNCSECSVDALERVQMKRAVAVAGNRYTPSAALRAKIAKQPSAKARSRSAWVWWVIAAPVLSVLLVTIGVNYFAGRESARRQMVFSELADLHVATLASASPVDVVSSDRHTVKPWFQGRIPFSFNLPELQGTEFTLIGGRVTYLAQTPGAHLIYQVRKHEISVFIFQDRGAETASVGSGTPVHADAFNFENWTDKGLRFFVVGDTNYDDIDALSKLLRAAQ